MGSWGFRKVFRVGRIGRIAIGKKSVGGSIGIGPIRVGVNSRGTRRARLTLPGTGVYYEERSRAKVASAQATSPARRSRFGVAFASLVLMVLAYVALRHLL